MCSNHIEDAIYDLNYSEKKIFFRIFFFLIFSVEINGEVADLSETEKLSVSGIENYTSLKAGAGIVTDIGYQSQTSTYSFETNNFEIAGLKQAYTTALKNYLNDRTIKIASNEEVKNAYTTFIKRLTEVVNKYKEENSID